MGDYAEFGPISTFGATAIISPPASQRFRRMCGVTSPEWLELILNWILVVPPMVLAVLATKALPYGFIDALKF